MPELPPFENDRLDDLRPGLQRWVSDSIEPGSFLRAVLKNDLIGACEMADDYNQRHLFDIVLYCYRHLPPGSWGSQNDYFAWRDGR